MRRGPRRRPTRTTPSPGTVARRVEEPPDREDLAGRADPPGRVVADRDEHPGQEQQRQDQRVHDRRGGVRVGNETAHRQADRGEAPGPQHERQQERPEVGPPGKVGPVRHHPERGGDRDQQEPDQHRVCDPRRQVDPRWERGAPHPLQDALVTGDHDAHREVRVARRDHPERRHRHDVVRRVVEPDATDDRLAAAEQGREDHQEQQREGEREEGRGGVPPEHPVRGADLADEQGERAHGSWPSSPVRSRYTSSSEGWVTSNS
jgi:hypothetical protein